MTSSVYIHIPFCNSICTYCNFTKFFYNEKMVFEYLNSLEREIIDEYKGETIKTLYIGGGTPSSLTIKELEKLFSIIKIFKLDKDFEFTIEVNPESITLEKLKLFKENKVNRISMGVESTLDKNLKYLGRCHDFSLVREKVNLIKEVGITNINVDLIYALKNESLKDLEKDIDNILSLDVPHISTYSLIIENNTILGINNEENIDEDKDFLMYDLIRNKLSENGYSHYEVSNFSKIGYESRHNLVYWNNEHYLGIGTASSYYIGDFRYTNINNLDKYFDGLDNNEIIHLEESELVLGEKMFEEVMLGLRKIEGFSISNFKEKYEKDIYEVYPVINELLTKGDLVLSEDYLRVPEEKIFILNNILINFLN